MTASVTTVVLGGARSGKSLFAERLARSWGEPVTYVATGPAPDPSVDAAWAERVAAHRARRPSAWTTVEVGGGALDEIVSGCAGGLLIDSLGTWVASRDLVVDGAALCQALRARAAAGWRTVVVSEETGLGVHPVSDLGRRFRDALGTLNQQVAAVADRAVLVVAGRVLELGPSVVGLA